MSAGRKHDPVQPELGAALLRELMLPVKSTRPVSGSVFVPLMNVVADTVTCQPLASPVLSLTDSC